MNFYLIKYFVVIMFGDSQIEAKVETFLESDTWRDFILERISFEDVVDCRQKNEDLSDFSLKSHIYKKKLGWLLLVFCSEK